MPDGKHSSELDLMLLGEDLSDTARVCDAELRITEDNAQLESYIAALTAHGGTPELLTFLDPELTYIRAGLGQSYAEIDPTARQVITQQILDKLESQLNTGMGMSQEGLSDVLKTIPGKIALKIGVAGVIGVTIGVYKRQLIDLISDGIATLSLMKTRWSDAADAAGKRIRGSSHQVMATLKRMQSIIETTDKLQKTIVETRSGTLPPEQGRSHLKQGIATLIAQGVPITDTGSPVISTAQTIYEDVPAEKAGWNAEALSITGSALMQIKSSVEKGIALKDTGVMASLDKETKEVLMHAQRACMRTMHYILFVLRRTNQVIDSVRFAFKLK